MDRTAPVPEAHAAPRDLAALAGMKLGNYRLERLVGRGRMGVVYLAKDEALLRPTAIKVLSWSGAEAKGHDPVQWFLAEARLVARINHPRVVQIYGAARHGDYCYIAMEYVPGRSAAALVAREPMPPELATNILVQAASALHAAHGSGVVHRDVTPANLLVGAGGETKLGDFGMALGPPEVRVTDARLRVGTPYYTAPEIWRGEAASPASDIYSLGATYFHLLTGRPPFPGHDIPAVEQAHLRAPPPDPRELVPRLPASCAALVQRALAKAPRDRHLSAQDLSWEARRVLRDLGAGGASVRAGGPPPVPSPAPAPRPATGPLAEVLGFARRPFTEPDLGALPGPLADARRAIAERLADPATPVLAVGGAEGGGAWGLCRAIAAALGGGRLVLEAEGQPGPDLVARLCRAAGIDGAAPDLEALVARLADARERRGSPPLLLVGWAAGQPAAGLADVARAAALTRAFQVLVVGAPGAADGLARSGVGLRERVPEIAVPPLDARQIAAYVRATLDATLAQRAPPLIVTPDALLLLALRSEGALERVNRIAENMLVLAAAERRRTLCSWHAWAASDRERWGERAAAALPRRPPAWPPPEVVDVIDACRRAAGMPPWPRAGARGR